ncbi:response regulator [Clostridiaceae bacterium 35-E11]
MIKVLIVEDDPMVREINEKFLEKIGGFRLHDSVNSIEKAKEAILREEPDLILLDVFFPQEGGLDLLKWVRMKNFQSDVILITADKNMDTVKEALRYGAVDYLIKPFVFERFKEAMLQFKQRMNSFEKNDCAEQEIIDKYTLNEKKKNVVKVDESTGGKGFNQYTYEKVLNCIHGMDGEAFTSQEIADKIGVSRITARRYLDYLEREQKIIMELEYGKIGRPQNKYRLKKD